MTAAKATASAVSPPPSTEIRRRVSGLMVFCLVFGAAIVGRATFIQVFTNARLEQMAKRQFQSKVLISPRRGTILDRNGEPLAVNIETQSLAANPVKIRNRKLMARLIAKATDQPVAKVEQRLNEGAQEKREFVWIKRHLPEAQVNAFKKWKLMDSSGDLVSGLWLVRESQRTYPHGELASHILGDVNVDSEGLEGTELWQNERLRGKVVSVSAIKDAMGRPTFIDAVAAKHVQDGEPIQLTIDASLQFEVEQRLKSAVAKHGARSGAVVVMNAVNGEILAMANAPSFNPNEKGVPVDRRRNRVLTDGYEPGSTLKAVLIASALSHGMKLSDQVWGERGTFKVQGKKISEAEAKEKFEWLSLKKIIQVSSNIGAAKVALKLGADHYYNTLKTFGIGARTDLGFPGEISGRVPPRKAWSPLSLANIGFGQGVLVTPIQMLRAYATFANGGWLVQPNLLKNPPEGTKIEAPKRIITEKVASDVTLALEGVTQDGGTGLKANLSGYQVAGKTGTAQAVDPATGRYSRSRHIASFIGYPVGLDQKIVVLTLIDEPRGVYFASETAAPLFSGVLNAVANRFGLPAKGGVNETRPVLAQNRITVSQAKAIPAPAVGAELPTSDMHWEGTTPTGAQRWTMPSLRGLTSREAMRAMRGHVFHMQLQGSGIVERQWPEEGKPITEGETLKLTLREP